MPANPVYTDGNYTVALAVSPLIGAPAFDGVNALLTAKQDFVQYRANYAALALNTPHPDDGTWLLVREDNFQDLGGGVQQWSRSYARIPEERVEGRAVAWQLPGLGLGGLNAAHAVTGIAGLGSDITAIVTVTTADAHGLAAGDDLIEFFGAPSSKYHQQQFALVKVLTAPTANTLTVYQGLLSGLPLTSVQKYTPGAFDGRLPESKKVAGKAVFDYYLVSSPEAIAILDPPVIHDINGLVTDSYSIGSTPNQAAYAAQITAGEWIVAEASVVRRWQGNIWERETVYVRAQ